MNSCCHISIGISLNGYWYLTYFMERELFKSNLNVIQTHCFLCIKKLAHFKFITLSKCLNFYTIFIKIISVSECYTQKNRAVTFVECSFHQGISYNCLLYCRIALVKQVFSILWLKIISIINAFKRITSAKVRTVSLSHRLNIIINVLVQTESKGNKIRVLKWNVAVISIILT
jgi:hypothetical protein